MKKKKRKEKKTKLENLRIMVILSLDLSVHWWGLSILHGVSEEVEMQG